MVELFSPRKVQIPDYYVKHSPIFDGAESRYTRRPRKLSPAEERKIRFLSQYQSLRSLAADFDVSHETVRTIIQERDATK